MKIKLILLLLLLACFRINISEAQSNLQSDTLKITLAEAEKMFLNQNLLLLAEKCNVEAAKAQIIQAKLFSNPNISIEQGVYDPDTKRVFDIDYSRNTGFTIQQLFYLAGKRNKRIKLEQINTQKQEYLLFDLMRTLKLQLRNDFNTLYYQLQTLKVYEKEINSLKTLITVFEVQNKNGFVSDKELIRLKASIFSLENDKLNITSTIFKLQTELGSLIRKPNAYIIPQLNESNNNLVNIQSIDIKAITETALQNRSDLKAAEQDFKWNQTNLSYQKALGVPDFTLMGSYSKQGSYVRNYNAITLAIDLPFFNRNQGNIKAAKFQTDNSKYILQNTEEDVKADVLQAYKKISENESVYKTINASFNTDFDKLLDEITKNYEKKNISLLEFIDFYDAYKENTNQMNSFLSNRLNSFEELNYSVGKNIINY
ncbi:MAG: TolC family protein [Bacteroidota bacterium]